MLSKEVSNAGDFRETYGSSIINIQIKYHDVNKDFILTIKTSPINSFASSEILMFSLKMFVCRFLFSKKRHVLMQDLC